MDYLNQLKQSASGLMGGTSSNSSAADSSGVGKSLLYAVVFALFAAVCYWAYTTYLAPALSNGNASLKQGASKVEGDDGAAADGADFDDAPIAELYLFKTDWCPHCKRAVPVFESLKQEYEHKLVNGYRVLFRVVDCEQEPKIADKFKIEGYPTIKLVKDDQVIEYDAKPDKEHLVQFLSTVI